MTPLASDALAIAAIAFLAAAPVARGEEIDGVEITTRSPWPENPVCGWAPHYVEVENLKDEDRHVRVEAESLWGGLFHVTRSVRLGPRERTRLELIVPAFPPFSATAQIRISVAGGRNRHLPVTSSSSFGVHDVRDVLLVSSRPPAAGDPERFASELEAAAGRVLPREKRDYRVTHVLPDDLPSRLEPYTSVRLVILDASGKWPEGAALDALVAGVHAGGTLSVCGEGALEKASGVPGLGQYLEDRFACDDSEGVPSFRSGFGVTHVRDGDRPFEDEGDVEAFRCLTWLSPRGLDVAVPSRGGGGTGEPFFDALPVRTMTALLLVFSLLMVFGNRAVVKRTRRPAILLVTVPVAGILASGAFLAYGLFYQGLDVKIAASSFAVLDQRSHRVAACESRDLFAGLSPGEGLRPASGTVVFRHREATWDRADHYTVDLDGGTLLSGSFIPVRQPIRQTIVRDAPSRLRVDFRTEDGRLVAENGLGTTIDALVVRDAEGRFHVLDAMLAPGGRARLSPIDADSAKSRLSRLGFPLGLAFDERLPRECYVASVAENVFRDPLGIEVNEVFGTHAVLGVLDASAEAWRR